MAGLWFRGGTRLRHGRPPRLALPWLGHEPEPTLASSGSYTIEVVRGRLEERRSVGIRVLVADRGSMRRDPEAVWPAGELIQAGFTADVTQVRVRCFAGART